MNSATLTSLREACGLTRSDLAGLIKSPKKPGFNIRERTIQYWEKGSNLIPDDVAKFIEELDKTLTELSEMVIRVQGAGDTLNLIRFRHEDDLWERFPDLKGLPVTCHAAFINRVRLKIDKTVIIEWYG